MSRRRQQLEQAGWNAVCVSLPEGHDPSSWFAAGHPASRLERYLAEAR